MKAKDLVKISKSIMHALAENGIKPFDYKHLDMVYEFELKRAEGEKTLYIIAKLSEKYDMSESTVKRIIKRMLGEVNS